MAAQGAPIKALAHAVQRFIEHHERATGSRTRKRRPVDLERYERRVEIVTANLAYAVLSPPDSGRLAVDTRQGEEGRSRYDNPALAPKVLRKFLWALFTAEMISWQNPEPTRGEKGSIAPSAWFAKKVEEFGVSLADFGRDPHEELIILTRRSEREFNPFSAPAAVKRERVNYRETSETTRLREQMRGLNNWLAAADITFCPDGGPAVDPYDRAQRRLFVVRQDQAERFDQSGRLFGGFWQQLKSHRRSHIRITGEEIATLDFSSMFTRLAYAGLKLQPPEGDLYAIPGLEGYRSGAKMAMNCFLFDQGSRRRGWPKEMGEGKGDDEEAADGLLPAAEYEARLPEGWSVSTTRKVILDRHPALVDAFGKGLGYRLMHQESQVLIAVLEELRGQGVVALGLHDGFLVARSKAGLVKAVMEGVTHSLTGQIIPVSIK